MDSKSQHKCLSTVVTAVNASGSPTPRSPSRERPHRQQTTTTNTHAHHVHRNTDRYQTREAIRIVTRKELAARANVSESTVTRVLSGGYVSEATRKRVLALVEELGYRPNALAQGLRTRKTYQIACIVLSIDNPFYSQVMLGVEEIANRHGYVLTMYSSTVVERNWEASFFTGRHDGIILLSINQLNVLDQLRGVQVPIITYSDTGPHAYLPYVSVDLEEAIVGAIDHLTSLGHTNIGYIGTDVVAEEANPRLNGFARGMLQHSLSAGGKQIQLIPGSGTMETGYIGMAELYRKYPEITAVVVMNDLIGFGAMRWMQDNGLRIPQDVSIVGCDDITYSSMSNPPLTTIQIPKRTIGNRMMEMLLHAIDNASNPNVSDKMGVELPTTLIVRASTTNVKQVQAQFSHEGGGSRG